MKVCIITKFGMVDKVAKFRFYLNEKTVKGSIVLPI